MRWRGRHYRTEDKIDVVCDRDRILRIEPAGTNPADREAEWLAPGFFDLQINGCHGIGFGAPNISVEKVRQVACECRRHGIVEFLPTLITGSFENLSRGFATLAKARNEFADLSRAIPGYHLEGPYLSPEDGPRGAHPREHVRKPDWDEFRRLQDAAEGRIRLVTLAPEIEGSIPFIEKLVDNGVVVAIGHTAADSHAIAAASRAGAKLSTHLGNGAHAVMPRHPNCIWDQLADDSLYASIICDGHHLPASVVKSIVRVKTPARTILTCDAGPLAGMPAGRYRDWGQELEVTAEGKIIVPGTKFLAGSWAFTDVCVSKVVEAAGVSLGDAVEMASIRVRELFDMPPRRLEVGDPADLIAFNWSPGKPLAIVS
ncbi:MAG: amidohydrolase family protein [Gemmataceae bacterium]